MANNTPHLYPTIDKTFYQNLESVPPYTPSPTGFYHPPPTPNNYPINPNYSNYLPPQQPGANSPTSSGLPYPPASIPYNGIPASNSATPPVYPPPYSPTLPQHQYQPPTSMQPPPASPYSYPTSPPPPYSQEALYSQRSTAPFSQLHQSVSPAAHGSVQGNHSNQAGFVYPLQNTNDTNIKRGSTQSSIHGSDSPTSICSASSAVDSVADEERTPLPANMSLLWESSSLMQLYFVQQEGHVVRTHRPLKLVALKCPTYIEEINTKTSMPPGSLSGHLQGSSLVLMQKNTWRLGLQRDRTKILMGRWGEIVLHDDSTDPTRTAILILPKGIPAAELQRLEVLIKASSSLCPEPTNAVEKAESGVETVYSSLTQGLNNLIRDATPEVHKTTKWVRKGTGSLLRFGGSLVSKGVHLLADPVVDKDSPTGFSPEHQKLTTDLNIFRKALNDSTITNV